MGNLILNFLREQGTLIVLAWMVVGGIFSQIMSSRRYRRLRKGIQSLAALQAPMGQASAVHTGAVQGATAQAPTAQAPTAQGLAGQAALQEPAPPKRTSRRSLRGRRGEEMVVTPTEMPSRDPGAETELDAQLLYLKQSLDRIAAGRDQKLEEEVREKRKLTPEQEAIIADILKEYLS